MRSVAVHSEIDVSPPRWLTPSRARWSALTLIAANFLAHLLYLTIACPIDLAEDEAYYWDWSRRVDICYFSKGPMTAYLTGASCAVFGNTMPAVRLPALLMGAGLLLCIFQIARRLFGDERLGLGAVMLALICPMIQAAGLIITTDPPFLFFWALATCLAIEAIFRERKWAWIAAGAVAGLGFLTKYSMPLWLAGVFAFLIMNRESRAMLMGRWPWLMLLTFVPFTLPMLIWNAQRHWPTLLHVSEDVGAHDQGRFISGNVIDYWTGQLAVIGPVLFVTIVIAAAWGIARSIRGFREAGDAIRRERRGVLFLLVIGLTVVAATVLSSMRTHPAANWPAGSYVTLLVLAALFLSRMLRQEHGRKLARVLIVAAGAAGAVHVALAHETQALYPAVARLNKSRGEHPIEVRKIDPTARLRGWREAGESVGGYLDKMKSGTMVMASDYPTAAAMAFYVPGQPKTYCIGSYFTGADREPFSQYDFWKDRRLDRASAERLGLIGRDAIYIGEMNEDVRGAFGSPPQRLDDIVVMRSGLEIRRMRVWRCSGFKGIAWPGWEGKYNK